jgi:hypothetical protein
MHGAWTLVPFSTCQDIKNTSQFSKYLDFSYQDRQNGCQMCTLYNSKLLHASTRRHNCMSYRCTDAITLHLGILFFEMALWTYPKKRWMLNFQWYFLQVLDWKLRQNLLETSWTRPICLVSHQNTCFKNMLNLVEHPKPLLIFLSTHEICQRLDCIGCSS